MILSPYSFISKFYVNSFIRYTRGCCALSEMTDLCFGTAYDIATWADPEGGDRGSGPRPPPPPLEFWQKCAYRIREMVLV